MLTDRAGEFAEHAERLLDEGNRHKDKETLAVAALCALASTQLQLATAPQEIELSDDPWAIHKATGTAPPCEHAPGAMGVCTKCGWDTVREAWPE